MGVVYQAEDSKLERTVALNVAPPNIAHPAWAWPFPWSRLGYALRDSHPGFRSALSIQPLWHNSRLCQNIQSRSYRATESALR